MSIKRILVPMFGTGADSGPIETAIVAARMFDAQVQALYFRPDVRERLSRVTYGESAAIDDDFVRGAVARAERAEQAARARFDALLLNQGIAAGDDPAAPARPLAAWREAAEFDPQALARDSAFADLIVIGRPGPRSEAPAALVDAALFGTGHPVLIAPPVAPSRLAGAVLVGWNPTVQAERAVVRALPFLQKAERVVVLAVATGTRQGPSAAEAVRYLAWHGVKAAVREIPPEDRPVGETLLAEARAMGADLLVMGAYSHSRLREMILGGVTRHVLEHAELPVLMAH
jgi:nucleotide-binding universal stress UspA family protein